MSFFRQRHFLAGGLCAVAKASRMIAQLSDADRGDVQSTECAVPSTRSASQKKIGESTTEVKLAYSPTRFDSCEEFDFIVVGNGTAGRSATEALFRTCPLCSIAIIDPHIGRPKSGASSGKSVRARATFLDPRTRVVRARDLQGEISLRYRCGVLLATGARGAPIPHYLVDDDARERVLELRPTTAPYHLEESLALLPSKQDVKEQVVSGAASGSTIGIVGSGWDALDLATSCRLQSSSQSGRVHLYYGDSLPLKNVLPNYLGAAVSKRLRSRNIVVNDRTIVRYITLASRPSKARVPLELHSVKSFDYLDSSIDQLDWLVVAPEVSGNRGTAVLPSDNFPVHLSLPKTYRSWYTPWSLLTVNNVSDPQQLACYKEDGRIAVNPELCACTGVYAAGSVAKYPNAVTGHADPAGYGTENSTEAGRVAAWNMSRSYRAPATEGRELTMVKSSVPIFRTDTLSCATGRHSSLFSLGVEALCVGHCDSERYSTCGIWWTNLASQRRRKSREESSESPVHITSTRVSCRPVFGVGVVYYLDRRGKIQGVMTWGIPFTSGEGRKLSSCLCSLMKELVLASDEFDAPRGLSVRNDLKELLTQKSRQLVSVAMDNHRELSSIDLKDVMSKRPLYRCTESLSPDMRVSGSLRRINANQWATDEDLFCRSPRSGGGLDSESGDIDDENLDHHVVWNNWLRREMQFDENAELARPLREEHLWLRKGDESRTVSVKDNKSFAYRAAIFKS